MSIFQSYKARIYLAGPIGGLSWDEANGWRNGATNMLYPMIGVSPMRPMEHNGEMVDLRDSCFVSDGGRLSNDPENQDKTILPFEKLFQRDYRDVHECDAVLFNFLNAPKQSFGTICELAWTYRRGIPAVVVINEGNPNQNPFGEQMYFNMVRTLADGVNYLRSYFGHPVYDLAGGDD